MARNYRDPFEGGQFYHIYNKVVTGETLFKTDKAYSDFIIRFRRYFQDYFSVYAYCLIPNHYHFLVQVKSDISQDVFLKEKTSAAKNYLSNLVPLNDVIENQLSRMFSGVALKYNKVNKRVGPLFKEGTKRVKLRTEGRMLEALLYIHHNPIHHGLVGSYDQWQYSSFNQYSSSLSRDLSESQQSLLELVGGIEPFLQLHTNYKRDHRAWP